MSDWLIWENYPGVEAIEDGDQFQAAAEHQAPPPKPVDEKYMFNLVNRFKDEEMQN